MRFSWKRLPLAILPVLALGLAGCGGFRTSQGVSPATFLLPGFPKLLRTTPAPASDPLSPAVTQVASVQ